MRFYFFHWFTLALLFLSINAAGQNIFVIEKAGRGGLFMYYTNDQISIKTVSDVKVEGRINLITDSSLIINYGTEVYLNEIAKVYKKRPMINLLQKVCLASGILYISINTLNGLINNDSPIVPSETLKISGGLVLAGVLMSPLTTRVQTVDPTKWKVKILDFTD